MEVYPKDLPVTALQRLLDFILQRNNVQSKEVVAAIYQLIGYALGQTFGEPTQLFAATNDPKADLMGLMSQVSDPNEMKGINPIWKLIIQQAIALALSLLARDQNKQVLIGKDA